MRPYYPDTDPIMEASRENRYSAQPSRFLQRVGRLLPYASLLRQAAPWQKMKMLAGLNAAAKTLGFGARDRHA